MDRSRLHNFCKAEVFDTEDGNIFHLKDVTSTFNIQYQILNRTAIRFHALIGKFLRVLGTCLRTYKLVVKLEKNG